MWFSKWRPESMTAQRWHQQLYLYALYASYFLIFAAMTGVAKISPVYLEKLETWLKYYVAFFLVMRFNPWSRDNRTDSAAFDRRVAFSAGVFLLFSSALASALQKHLSTGISSITGRNFDVSFPAGAAAHAPAS